MMTTLATTTTGGRSFPLRPAVALLALVAILAAALAPHAPAQASTSIRLVVNNQPITNYDIAQRARLLRLTGVRGNPTRAAEEELINETLQMQEARRAGISVSDREVDQAIGNIASRAGISQSQLRQALGQQGVRFDTLEDRIRAQIAWGRLVSARFRATSPVTEQDLVAALRESGGETARETTEYSLEQVIVVLPANASRSAKNAAMSRANSLRGRFTSCEEGLPFARKLDGVVVKPFGRRLASEMPGDLAADLEKVSVGRLSGPIDRPEGIVMFAVCDKRNIRSTAAAMNALEGELRSERGERFAQQWLRTLRRDALIERR